MMQPFISIVSLFRNKPKFQVTFSKAVNRYVFTFSKPISCLFDDKTNI